MNRRINQKPANNTILNKSSRVQSTKGLGRDSRNYQNARSPNKFIHKFSTPEKLQKSQTKLYSTKKKNTQFNPKDYMVAECQLRDIQIYKQVFDFLDQDHDGNLTPLDLRKCIRQFGGYNPGRKFVYVAMSVFDTDAGGEIDFKEFIKLMTTRPKQKDTQDDLIRVFETIDEEGKGYIDQNDLLKLAEQLNDQVTIEEVRQAILLASPEGEGKMTLSQFIKFSKKKDYD